MKEKSIYKYLIYSIGEIILIAIGILIALQVNNWNEKQKNGKIELKILTTIKEDLDANILSFKSRIKTDSFVVENCNKLIDILKDSNSEYDQSMDKLFGRLQIWESVHPKKLGYSNLQAQGSTLITSDSIQSLIIKLYDQTYLLHQDIENIMLEMDVSGTKITHRYLETGENLFLKKPNDFNQLKNETMFMNYLTNLRSTRDALRKVIKNDIQVSTINLRDRIEDEIERLSNK